jgi:hypothetical protein
MLPFSINRNTIPLLDEQSVFVLITVAICTSGTGYGNWIVQPRGFSTI